MFMQANALHKFNVDERDAKTKREAYASSRIPVKGRATKFFEIENEDSLPNKPPQSKLEVEILEL